MNKAFLLFISVIVSLNGFKLQLKERQILSQVQEHPIDDLLYTTPIRLTDGGKPIEAVFDINSSTSWLVDNTCTNCKQYGIDTENAGNENCPINGAGTEEFYIFAGEVLFLRQKNGNSYATGMSNIYLKGMEQSQLVPNITFWKPYQIASPQSAQDQKNEKCDQCSKTSLLMYAQAGLGFGPNLDNFTPFTEGINKKIKMQESRVSFYQNADYMEVQFGEPENYFKTGEWFEMKNARKTYKEEFSVQTSFSLKCVNIGIDNLNVKLDAVDPNTRQSNLQFGVFTSTSKYIYFGHIHIVENIVKQINTVTGAECSQSFPHNIFACNKNKKISDFPVLKWTFQDQNDKHFTMDLHPENYLERIIYAGQERLILLLRPGKFELQQSTTYNLAVPNIWLGYPFFKEYYLSFNYQKDSILFAKRYQINREPLLLPQTFATAVLLIVGVLLVICLVVLFVTMKPLPKGKWINIQVPGSEYFTNTQLVSNQPIILMPTTVVIPSPNSKENKLKFEIMPTEHKIDASQLYTSAIRNLHLAQELYHPYVPENLTNSANLAVGQQYVLNTSYVPTRQTVYQTQQLADGTSVQLTPRQNNVQKQLFY